MTLEDMRTAGIQTSLPADRFQVLDEIEFANNRADFDFTGEQRLNGRNVSGSD